MNGNWIVSRSFINSLCIGPLSSSSCYTTDDISSSTVNNLAVPWRHHRKMIRRTVISSIQKALTPFSIAYLLTIHDPVIELVHECEESRSPSRWSIRGIRHRSEKCGCMYLSLESRAFVPCLQVRMILRPRPMYVLGAAQIESLFRLQIPS